MLPSPSLDPPNYPEAKVGKGKKNNPNRNRKPAESQPKCNVAKNKSDPAGKERKERRAMRPRRENRPRQSDRLCLVESVKKKKGGREREE
jgi:hypothetical protein